MSSTPKEQCVWVNIFYGAPNSVHASKEIADKKSIKGCCNNRNKKVNRVACIKMKWEEGQFDE